MTFSTRHLALIPIILAYWAAGFYPFQLDLPSARKNAAIIDSGSLLFPAAGLAHTDRPPLWMSDAITRQQFDITVEACPSLPIQTGPARIVAISKDVFEQNLVIGHEMNDLIVRIRRPLSHPDGTPPFIIEDVFAEPGCREISVSVRESMLTIAVAGFKEIDTVLNANALLQWNDDFRLVVGNEQTGDRPWLGRISKLLAGNRFNPTDYLAEPVLQLPPRIWYIPRRIRGLAALRLCNAAAGPCSTSLRDAARNLAGFIPFPFLVIFVTGRANATKLIWGALGVSLSIEAGQTLLATRSPSLVDLVLNVLGAAIGMGLLQLGARLVTARG